MTKSHLQNFNQNKVDQLIPNQWMYNKNIISMKISKLNNRIMFLSPTVQAGWQSESLKTDFDNIGTLGKGSYGTVWKAKHKKTGVIYAIKEVKKKSLTTNKLVQHVKTEVKIMYCLNHPHIIKVYNHFEDEFAIYFILEYAEKGELYKTLLKQPQCRFSEQEASKYIREVTLAINYIHSQKVIHRDIKPENILISADNKLKLADFGWSNFTNSNKGKRLTYCGTIDYLAPQMADSLHVHDYRVDIWSIGVLIFELTSGESPFSSELEKINQLSQEGIKDNIIKVNYKMPEFISSQCKDLIKKILVKKPYDRISIEQILNHPWIMRYWAGNSNIREEEKEQKSKWSKKLKEEFHSILQNNEQVEVKKYEVFSKQEIYDYSRVESVIKQNQQKQSKNISDFKYEKMQMRIKQLQMINRSQEEEMRQLRLVKNQHMRCKKDINELEGIVKDQARKIDVLYGKVKEYEKKEQS